MVNKGFIKKGEYFDSVSLMIVSREITKLDGVEDSAVVMGTRENKSILEAVGLMLEDFTSAGDTDLLIAIKAESDPVIESVLVKIDELFLNIRNRSDDTEDFNPKSLAGGLKQLPDANLSIISIPGKYAAREAKKALEKDLHVMIFSDNVSIEEEFGLKKFAKTKDLFVMGPDCGTAIINGVPLAFANVVNRGDIGIVAASGTGLQEVSSIISNMGAGISQAIGTGGRDVKKEIGGIMFLQGISALNDDPSTKTIVLISKPPDDEVLSLITEELKQVEKPIVAIFIGGNPELIKKTGAISAKTLEHAALIAVSISKNEDYDQENYPQKEMMQSIAKIAENELKNKQPEQKYLRGLFSGGTLCDETQLIFKGHIGDVYSNTPLNKNYLLDDSSQSVKNTVLDLGDDEFTVGRPHPMIDFTLRNERILKEVSDPETAVILVDLVLGYGSNLDPVAEFVPVLAEAKKLSPYTSIICSITGTENDPQEKDRVILELEKAGIIICSSNAEASYLAGEIIKLSGGK